MRNSLMKLASPALLAGAALLALGAVSCSKQEGTPDPGAGEGIVAHAVIRAGVQGGSPATKASVTQQEVGGETHRILQFEAGDKLVMASGGTVSGTLRCTGADPSDASKMLFEGEAYNFDPSDVNFFYVGEAGVTLGTSTINVDLSSQKGKLDLIEQNLSFVKIMGAKFTKDPDNEDCYIEASDSAPTASAIEGIKVVKVTIDDLPGSPMEESGVWPTKVSIDGLKNQMRLSVKDGSIAAAASDDAAATVISPASSSDYAASYYLAVLPQTASGLSMTVNFSYGDVRQKTWSGFTWNVKEDFDGSYTTIWTGKGLAEVYLTTKGGYDGVDVGETEEEEPSAGDTKKQGYDGSPVDGSDDVNVTKNNYDGQDVN